MRRKNILLIVVLVLIVPIVEGYYVVNEMNDPVSIAVYGQCVNAVFDMVYNQTIETSFNVRNTGTEKVDVNITFERSDDTLEIACLQQNFIAPPRDGVLINCSFHLIYNTSEIISSRVIRVDFKVIASSSKYDFENPVSSSVITSTYIQVNEKVRILYLEILDQYENPYEGLDVELIKDDLIYAKSKVGASGIIKYILAGGSYIAKVYDGKVLQKEVEVLINRDITNTTIYVPRNIVVPERTFATLNVIEILAGVVIGYLLKTYEVKRKGKTNVLIKWSKNP